ncbi:hypothetical protein JCM11491_007169 [Sporobolomyces phaffii]
MASLVARESLNMIQSTTVLLAVHGALFGYFSTEIGIYFVRFPKDRVGFRILVYWLALVQCVYMAIKIGNFVTLINRALGNTNIHGNRLWLTFSPILVTVTMEATTEGFFCWRLCAISNKLWMKAIACLLWTFSTTSHIIWVAMLGTAWQLTSPDVADPPRLRILLMMSFWGTAAENIWISGCLVYELALSRDRKALKGAAHSGSISKLVSLAMRTSAILIVFELLVAIIVSVGNQDEVAVMIETNFATAIYTVLTSIVVLHTLNYRTKIREASGSSPIFFAPTKRSSFSTGGTRTNASAGTNPEGGVGGGRGVTRSNTANTSPTLPNCNTCESSGTVEGETGIEEDGTGNQISRTVSGGGGERWRRDRKRERTKSSGRKPKDVGVESGGIGITVQTISWVMEEERTDGGNNEDKVEMVIERGKKDLASRTHFLRP